MKISLSFKTDIEEPFARRFVARSVSTLLITLCVSSPRWVLKPTYKLLSVSVYYYRSYLYCVLTQEPSNPTQALRAGPTLTHRSGLEGERPTSPAPWLVRTPITRRPPHASRSRSLWNVASCPPRRRTSHAFGPRSSTYGAPMASAGL